MPDDDTTKRFETLLAAFVDGVLEDERVPEFMALLEADASRVDALRDQLMMDACLTQFESGRHSAEQFTGTLAATLDAEGDAPAFVDAVIQQVKSSAINRPRKSIIIGWPAAVAAIIVFGLAINHWNQGSTRPAHEVAEQPAPTNIRVAEFTRLQESEWRDSQTRITAGEGIERGQSIDLLSGVAELRFASGARVTITGPAILEPLSDNSARLVLGEIQVVAETPESKGFTVVTPTSKFVDISTAFTAGVSPDGLSHLQVSEGEVDVVLDGVADTPRLKAGQALFVEPGKRKVMTRIESGDGTRAFRFPTIKPPSGEDYADRAQGHATIRVAQGELKRQPGNSGVAGVLLDGAGQSLPDAPHQSAFFREGSAGSFLVDLGQAISITEVNTYSWHQNYWDRTHRHRATQRFTLFGFSGDSVPELTQPLRRAGWQRIARVNSDKFFDVSEPLERPPQQACSIAAAKGEIGRFRYLLWVTKGHTFFGEFDIFGTPDSETPGLKEVP